MDSKRFILALTLSVAVMFIISTLFPPAPKTAEEGSQAADSSTVVAPATPETSANVAAGAQITGVDSMLEAADQDSSVIAAPAIEHTNTIVGEQGDSGAVFTLSNIGAAPVSVLMNAYKFATPSRLGEQVNLESPGLPLIKYQLLTNSGARIDLGDVPFSVMQDDNTVTYSGTANGYNVSFNYTFVPDSHTARVTGSVSGSDVGFLLVDIPTTLPATEKDTAQDFNALAYAYLSKRDGAKRVNFKSLDPGEKLTVEGPVNWLAVKTKYFVFGILAPEETGSFAEAVLVGGPRTSSIPTNANGTIVMPVKDGMFEFDMYAGPQEWKRLNAQGREFDQVNPYGWSFLRGILQPISTMVIRLVLWMHSQLNLSYGVVLVALGFLVRLILWPLNQTAMRTSLRMQELQPELQATQKKYKDDVETQRKEIMKLYQSHGMSPLSPLMGCLPMLLPMPILFALFFVFQNTIEFRGVSFLWVADLSAYDPYYIWPVMMAISMFFLSWIGARNAPPNPQTKMMMYIMPAMLLLFLSRMAAGLNVYYAAQNIAALPQQWFISKEQARRRAAKGTAPVATTAPARAKPARVAQTAQAGRKSRKRS